MDYFQNYQTCQNFLGRKKNPSNAWEGKILWVHGSSQPLSKEGALELGDRNFIPTPTDRTPNLWACIMGIPEKIKRSRHFASKN